MKEVAKRYSVKLNNVDKLEALLQETYDLACQQYNKLIDEINKIASTTVVNDLDIEGKEKYGKIMSGYHSLLQKCSNQKFDIAKLMAEIIKHKGNLEAAIEDSKGEVKSLDFKRLREIARESGPEEKEASSYTIR